jgi:hypothetical protein
MRRLDGIGQAGVSIPDRRIGAWFWLGPLLPPRALPLGLRRFNRALAISENSALDESQRTKITTEHFRSWRLEPPIEDRGVNRTKIYIVNQISYVQLFQ